MQSNIGNTPASGGFSSGLGRTDQTSQADETTSELLSLNALQFTCKDSSLSLVTSKVHRRFNAVRLECEENNVLQYRFDCGSQFLNPATSYISFDILAGSSTVFLIPGMDHSVLNIFDTYKFQHASGVEIENTEDYNTWLNIREKMTKNKFYKETIGQLYKTQVRTNAGEGQEGGRDWNLTPLRVTIPLCLLSDMFRQNVMLPPWLMSGAIMSMRLAPAWKAFIASSSTATSYTLSNCHMVLDLYTLSDGTVRALADLSASSGLDIDFTSVWMEQNDQNKNYSLVNTTSKALSQVSVVHGFPRSESAFNPAINWNWDLFATRRQIGSSQSLGVGGYYLTHGAQFLPQRPIDNVRDLYAITQQAWNVYQNNLVNNTLVITNFTDGTAASTTYPTAPNIGATDAAKIAWCMESIQTGIHATIPFGLFSYNLERSPLLSSSVAVSSQRPLTMHMNVLAPVADPPAVEDTKIRFTVFLEYSKVVTVFLDSCVVKS